MRKNNLPIKCELLSCRARGLFTVSVLWAAAVAVKQLSSYGAIQTSAAQPFESQPRLAMEGWGRSRVQGGWAGEGRGGRRSPRNVVRPRDGEIMADNGNEPNTKLYGDEHSSSSPPWVVNVSKVIMILTAFPVLAFYHAAGTSCSKKSPLLPGLV